MNKAIIHRITSVLLLVTLLVPVSLQFIHSFETHSFQSQRLEGLDNIQKTPKNCAIYHQQINHNVVDLNFDFELTLPVFLITDFQLIDAKPIQTTSHFKSSRAPPISFV
ncbi:MAG: hypothetical protein GQ552_08725 [Flavobacteriaceae bacterium]|nr:hypothetical protein [Flavobacteriaceae bacterium]